MSSSLPVKIVCKTRVNNPLNVLITNTPGIGSLHWTCFHKDITIIDASGLLYRCKRCYPEGYIRYLSDATAPAPAAAAPTALPTPPEISEWK